MNRAPLVSIPCVLLLASVAAAQEYTPQSLGTGGYVVVPAVPADSTHPEGFTQRIAAKRDGVTVGVALPFEFQFFARAYSRITLSDDGWLAFGDSLVVQSDNPTLPAMTGAGAVPNLVTNAMAAPLWDDLRTRHGSVVTFVTGDAPKRSFVVAWRHLDTTSGATDDDLSFEVILHEISGDAADTASGAVDLAYDRTASLKRWSGLSFTAGIQDVSGARAFPGPGRVANDSAGRPDADVRFVPNIVRLSGQITRNRPVATAAGLVATPDYVPVAGTNVSVLRDDAPETAIATALTGSDGSVSLAVFGVDGAPSLSVHLLASGRESNVVAAIGSGVKTRRLKVNTQPINPTGDTSITGDPAVTLVRVDEALDGRFSKELNIQQSAHRGFLWAAAALGLGEADAAKTFPRLDVVWVPGQSVISGYTPASGSAAAHATISDATSGTLAVASPDAYDDDVILREYAQHVLASISKFQGSIAAHQWTSTPTTPMLSQTAAFLDGFSFWFAAAVQRRAEFFDVKTYDIASATAATVFDLETPVPAAPAANGASETGAVAASLWDLVDAANETHDEFAGRTAADAGPPSLANTAYQVLAAIDQRVLDTTTGVRAVPSAATPPTIRSFFDVWRAQRPGLEPQQTARNFIHHGTLPDDKYEPNDTPAASAPYTEDAGVHRMSGLTLNPSNEDRFSFKLGGSQLSVAVQYASATDAELTVLDASGAPIAPAAASPATGAKSPLVVTTPLGLAPGTYFVRLLWKSGSTATYTLSITSAPALRATPLMLPDWSVGRAYLPTAGAAPAVGATGGDGTVTLALAAPIPGLQLVAGTPLAGDTATSYLTGSPTAAGDYDVKVTASDGGVAGPLTAGVLHLTIHDAPSLIPVVAVSASETVDLDIGRFGTNTTWTVGAPAAGGFALTGGAVLHLHHAGTPGQALAVELKASATDVAGATVATAAEPESSWAVVCPCLTAKPATPDLRKPFGFAFDAVAGTHASIEVQFAGRGTPPRFRAILDDAGGQTHVPDAALRERGAVTTLSGVEITATGRYFIVFDAADKFTGSISSVRWKIAPTRRFAGIANAIAASVPIEIARFSAIAGSAVTIVLSGGPVQDPATPDGISLVSPSGAAVAVTAGASHHGERTFSATLPGSQPGESGEYIVTATAKTTGSLACQVSITPPKRGACFLAR